MTEPWVELRIHGVSGTPPEAMLGCDHVRQVAGDDLWRVFVPVDSIGNPSRRDGREQRLEGFHWGQFTSGSWRQGLWLVLIPFGIVNAAQFMLPPATTSRARLWHAVASAMIRSVGYLLTLTIALATGLMFVDLLASHGSSRIGFLDGLDPGTTRILCGLVAAAVITVLYRMGWVAGDNPPPTQTPGSLATAARHASGLARPDFFSGNPNAPTLSHLHFAGGIGLIALMMVATVQDPPDGLVHPAAWLYIAFLVVVLGLVAVFGDPAQSLSSKSIGPTGEKLIGRSAVAGAGVLFICAAAAISSYGTITSGKPPIFADIATGIGAVATLALLLLFPASLLLSRARTVPADTPQQFKPYAAGFAAPLAASVGTFLGVGFSAAFTLATAQWVHHPEDVPDMVDRISHIWGLTALTLGAIALYLAVFVGRRRRGALTEVDAAYSRVVDKGLPPSFRGRVATAIAVARAKNAIPLIFWVLSLVGLVLATAAVIELNRDTNVVQWVDERRGDAGLKLGILTDLSATTQQGPQAFIELGKLFLITLAGYLLLAGRRAVSGQGTRRTVNVIWDVISFWPHAAHPFVPPPYSQTAVHKLRERIEHYTQANQYGDATDVVVAAHSQGSLISLAALLWLAPEDRARVGFLTFGSQLQVAFPRAFPAYVGYQLLLDLHAGLASVPAKGRWVNLYRSTDPIAGPVLSWAHSRDDAEPVTSRNVTAPDAPSPDELDPQTGCRRSGPDWRVLDPPPVSPQLQTHAIGPLDKHSRYYDAADWERALKEVKP